MPDMHQGMTGEIVIGIVNLMPPGGMKAVETQFTNLLPATVAGVPARLRRFALAAIGDYEAIEALWPARLDGVIVTGTQPQAAQIPDEPCWPALAQLVDWASERAGSVMWSCLAAQAAVYRLDGIARRRLPQKLSGIYAAEAAGAHPVTVLLPRRWALPHSRYNTLDEAALRDHGYTILTRGEQVGADIFMKPHGDSLFVLLQGHPEYLPGTLPGEYLRDVRRYLAGQSEVYPGLPENVFGPDSVAVFARLREAAMVRRDVALLEALTQAPEFPEFSWRAPAQALFDGWLSYLVAQKAGLQPA